MKRILITTSLLLFCAGAFAQQYANTATITRPVTTGVVEEKGIDRLMATNAVESGATARYVAGQSITLQPGFVARAGSVFQATIGSVTSRPSTEGGTMLTVMAFPNPVETITTVEYSLPKSNRVIHTLTDATGRPIKRSSEQEVESAGTHHRPLDLSQFPVGIYLYQVETPSGSKVIRLIKK
jgi:Secretion system C-terminal sorting domain